VLFVSFGTHAMYSLVSYVGEFIVSYFPQYSRAALSQLHTENSSPKELQNPLDSVSENVQDALNSEPEQETNELESTALSAMNEDRRELINKILKELDTSKKQLDSLQREELLKSTVHSDTIDKIQDSNSIVENNIIPVETTPVTPVILSDPIASPVTSNSDSIAPPVIFDSNSIQDNPSNAPIVPEDHVVEKVFISEVQIAGQTVKDEFIELYNPNTKDVNLTGFSLKKKTSTGNESNLISASAFSGIIPALGFFLIAPQKNDDGTENYQGLVVPNARYSGKSFSIADNNTILLYDPNDVLVDKVGFGSAQDFETAATKNPPTGNSISRKYINSTETGQEQDSDNNSLDFEVKSPTPNTKNEITEILVDSIAPVRSDGLPSLNLVSGTLETSISLQTDESATCKYATTANQEYDAMLNTFVATQSINHTSLVVGLTDGTTYNYYIRCADTVENKNKDDFVITFSVNIDDTPLPVNTVNNQISVAINEIAWMGTTDSANNEWIELKNNTANSINLDGWTIKSGDDNPTINLTGIISENNFYLLERTSDTTLPNVVASQIYAGALGNSGEHLYLYDNLGALVDKIDCSSGWFTGSNTTKQTMERKDSTASGSEINNWQTSSSPGGSPQS